MAGKFKPYIVRDIYGTIKMDRLIVEPTFGGVRAIYCPLVMPGLGVGVLDTSILAERLPDGLTPYYVDSNTPLQSLLGSIKVAMLEHGATPEAVRLFLLLGQLTKKELMMATEKLAGKGKAPAAAKAAPAAKAPAAEKPAKVAKAPKAAPAAAPAADKPKKPLPAALQKAADAKSAASKARDGFKVTILTEKKANPYREGTKAHATFELFKANHGKTIGDIKAAASEDDHDLGYLRYADRDGHIKIG